MQKLWMRYSQLLDKDLNAKIFDNFKNMVLCALLFAAGTNALHSDHKLFMSITATNLAGWGVITISAILMLLNVSDGIRRLAQLRYHLVFQLLIVLVYILISARVVEMVWSYRA
ncbi:hypothetical protein GV729_16785 [Pseudomonas sp. Fl4BN2]|nr:hypothetical protein [Pseudomonas sp. Fl4BN2]